jgi:DNA-binding MarR family transcriptional regulator
MRKKSEHQQIIDSFIRVINKFSRLEKIARDFGTGDVLYPSEIHMIDMIGKNPGINLTELAKRLGITKGAVPKMILKLDKKNLIKKFDSEKSRREVLFELSEKGKAAFRGHETYHRNLDKGIKEKLDAISAKERVLLHIVFRELEHYSDRLLEDS